MVFAGYAVLCVAMVMSVVMFVGSIWLLKVSMSLVAEYMHSLISSGERMLGSIEEQIQILRQQIDHEDMYLSMETGEMFDHEDDDD